MSEDFEIPDPIERLQENPKELKDADPELVAELARRYLFNSRYWEIWELGEPDEPETDEEWTAYWESLSPEATDELDRRMMFEEDYGQRHKIKWLEDENSRLRKIIVDDITGETVQE